MRTYLFPVILLLAAGITGCKVSSNDSVTTVTTSHTSGRSIAIHATGHPDANITGAGDLNIAGAKVAVTPEQRELLTKYYVITVMMRDPAIAAGNPDLAAHAEQVCTGLTELASSQAKQLASQIPVFQPYALSTSHEIDSCRIAAKNRS